MRRQEAERRQEDVRGNRRHEEYDAERRRRQEEEEEEEEKEEEDVWAGNQVSGLDFGRILVGTASKSVLRPAEGRPEGRTLSFVY